MQALALVAIGAVILIAYFAESNAEVPQTPADSSPSSPTIIVIQGAPGAPGAPGAQGAPGPVATQRAPTSIPSPPENRPSALGNPFAQAVIPTVAPFAPQIAGNAFMTAGAGVERITNPFGGRVAPADASIGGLGASVGDKLSEVGASVSSMTGLGLVGVFAGKTIGIRGQTDKEQKATFGQAALATAQTGIAVAVPLVGSLVSGVVGLAARTETGQRVVAQTGRTVFQGYEGQKKVLRGDFTGTAGNERARKGAFYSAIEARAAELKVGGKLEEKDVSGFKQAIAYGYTLAGDVDLTKLSLEVGTNPFHESYKPPVVERS